MAFCLELESCLPPDDERIRNRARDIGPGLDTRGVTLEGRPAGYIVVPPSAHYSGGRYRWETPNPDFRKVASAPLWLVFLATFNKRERDDLALKCGIMGPDGFGGVPASEWPKRAAELLDATEHRHSGPTFSGANGSDRDWEHYALRAINEELNTLVGTLPGGQEVAVNDAALRIWSLVRGAGLEHRASEFQTAFLNACRSLSNEPERPRWTERDFTTKWDRARTAAHPRDLSHVGGQNGHTYLGTYHQGESRDRREEQNGGQPEPETWDSPDLSLLGTGRRAAPAFPIDTLGPSWTEWATRRAAAASAPVDYVAVSLLASTAALLANVRWPVAGAGWCEPPVLWCGLVGSPSAGKSPAMDAAFRLVGLAEDRLATGFDAILRQHETAKEVAKARRDAWEAEVQRAVKAGENPPNMPEDAEVPEAPVRPRLRIADTTAEKLAALAAGLPRGLLLVRDELAGWFGGFGRYNGGGADRAFAIEMYGGRSYTVDRMKNPEPLRIRHLSVGVLGGVQPDKVAGIIEGPDDGLASRLLWSWPEAVPAFNLAREPADDHEAQNAFARLADLAMGSDDLGQPVPKRLALTPEAENVIEEFGRDMQFRGDATTGMFAGTLGKARGHALRLSCVLEHLWWSASPTGSEPTTISADAVIAAGALVESYFLPMAERAFGDAAIPPQERAAMMLVRHIRTERLTHFNARDVRRAVSGPVREPAAMNAACGVLIEAGLIRAVFSRTGTRGGRSAQNYIVNPVVHGRAA